MPDYVNMVNAVIHLDRREDLLRAIAVNATASLGEPGCQQFEVLIDPSAPDQMVLYEVYRDEAAFLAHQQTPHHRHYFEQAHALLSHRRKTPFHRVFHEQKSTQSPTPENKMTVSIVVTAEVKPENFEALMHAMKTVARASLGNEPGCLQFDILTDQVEPSKLMLYEVYADEAASLAHQQTPHFQAFIEAGVPLFAAHSMKAFGRAAP